MKLKLSPMCVVGLILLLGLPVLAGSTYSVYSDPPLGNGGTLRYGLNDFGSYVGWTFSSGTYFGFSVGPDGVSSPVAPPAAIDTHPTGINDNGLIAGYFSDKSGTHAFLDAGGVYSTLNAPGATATYAYGINTRGQVVGYYVDVHGAAHAFIAQNGVFTTIDFPGAVATYGLGINDNGEIVGSYFDGTAIHGFTYHNNGIFDTLDYPGATVTWLTGIDSAGLIIGWSRHCPACPTDQFLKPATGLFWLPDVAEGSNSYFTDINNFGLTVGIQVDGLLPGNITRDQYRGDSSLLHAPEPGGISLMLAGALTLLLARRFRKKK
jgi:probable HAF family extracellular repeat protein